MKRAEQARLLRSAASALEHGRLQTARRKIAQAVGTQYAIVTVSGGVADLAHTEGYLGVDILDYDNLKDCGPGDIQLSDGEWAYLKEHSPDLFEFFAPSFAKKDG